MALGALGVASNFAGGMADSMQEGEKLRLQQQQQDREDQAQKIKNAEEARTVSNLAETRAALSGGGAAAGPSNNLVYNGSNFPDAGYGTYAEAAGIPTDTIGFLKKIEGYSAEPYGDYRQTSIGYGTRAQPGETHLSPADAEARLNQEAGKVNDFLSANVKVPLTQGQRTALTSFGYNLGTGPGGLSDLVPQINAGDWNGIAQRMQHYNKAGGQVNPALVDRRKQEASLLFEPGAESAVAPSVKTATADTGTATDAALPTTPAASDGGPKFISPAGAPTNTDGTPATTAALPAAAAAPAPAAIKDGQVVIQDQQTGRYHRVDKSDTREKNPVEQARDYYSVMLRQGKGEEGAHVLYQATQSQLALTKFDQEATQRRLQQAAVGGPEAFAAEANKQLEKTGLHGELVPETIDIGGGKRVTVLKVNQKGTNAPPMYYNRYGQLTSTPDPEGFTGAVSGISGLFSGDVAANVAQVAKTQTEIEQARINSQKAATEAAKLPYEIEELKGKPALQQAQTANYNAEAKYRENQMRHDSLQLEAQARMKAAEDVNKLRINGILDPDPVKQAKQIGDIYSQYNVSPTADFTTKAGAPAPGAGGALPGPTTTTVPNPYAASPTPAAAPAPARALPAPRDNTASGLMQTMRGLPGRMQDHQQAAAQDEATKEAQKAAKTALESPDISATQHRVWSDISNGRAPGLKDVRTLHGLVEHFPGVVGLINPQVLDYVRKFGG